MIDQRESGALHWRWVSLESKINLGAIQPCVKYDSESLRIRIQASDHTTRWIGLDTGILCLMLYILENEYQK